MSSEVVAVTGADGQVGRALLSRLQGGPKHTVAITRRRAELPATETVVGDLSGPGPQEALRRADFVVHLAGALRPLGRNTYEAANIHTARAVSEAARAGSPKRIIFLSYVGASEQSKNRYLRAKAAAERMLAETGRDLVVFRCSFIIGSPAAPGPQAAGWLAHSGRKVTVVGTGRQLVAPLFVGDVAAAIESALTSGAPGTYDLAGPEVLAVDELVRLLNRNPAVPMSHVPPVLAHLVSFVVPSLPRPLIQAMLADSVGDASRAVRAFGLRMTSLRGVWR